MLNAPIIIGGSAAPLEFVGVYGSLEMGDLAYTKGEKVRILTPKMTSDVVTVDGVTWTAFSCRIGNIAANGAFDWNTATNTNNSLWFPAMNTAVTDTYIGISASDEITADYVQIYAASAQERTGTTLTATLVVQASADGNDYVDVSDEFELTEKSLTASTVFASLKPIPAGTKYLKLAMRRLLANGAEAQYTHVQNVYAFGIAEIAFYKKI